MSYPNPCDRCETCTATKGCEAWLTRYRYRQKQINAYARKLMTPAVEIKKTKGFACDHPDDVRRYLRTHPCRGCRLEPDCDTPCEYYLCWYNARIQYARKKVGL